MGLIEAEGQKQDSKEIMEADGHNSEGLIDDSQDEATEAKGPGTVTQLKYSVPVIPSFFAKLGEVIHEKPGTRLSVEKTAGVWRAVLVAFIAKHTLLTTTTATNDRRGSLHHRHRRRPNAYWPTLKKKRWPVGVGLAACTALVLASAGCPVCRCCHRCC